MNTPNQNHTQAQNETKPVIDLLAHRLNTRNDDITDDHDFIDTIDTITLRATGILEVMANLMTESSRNRDSFINQDAMYWTLQSAINEIKDINTIVNFYVKSKSKA